MKKGIVFVLILFCSSPTFSQDLKNQNGMKALSFGFNGLNLSSLNGGIGGKYWTSNKIVWRFSVDFDYEHRKTEDNTDTESKSNEYEIGFSPSLEYHYNKIDKLSPYIGMRLHIFYRKNNFTSNGISIGPIVGFEYFLGKRISLAGQYHMSFTYLNQNSDSSESEKQIIHIGFGTSSLIISIYF